VLAHPALPWWSYVDSSLSVLKLQRGTRCESGLLAAASLRVRRFASIGPGSCLVPLRARGVMLLVLDSAMSVANSGAAVDRERRRSDGISVFSIWVTTRRDVRYEDQQELHQEVHQESHVPSEVDQVDLVLVALLREGALPTASASKRLKVDHVHLP
jgi:hypothetical protein